MNIKIIDINKYINKKKINNNKFLKLIYKNFIKKKKPNFLIEEWRYSKINYIIKRKYNIEKKNKKLKIDNYNFKKDDINIFFINGFFYKYNINNINLIFKIKKKKINNINKYLNLIKNYNYFSYLNIISSFLNKNKCIFLYIKNKNKNKKYINLKLNYIYNIKKSIMTNIKIFIFVRKNTFLNIKEKYIINNKNKKILHNNLLNIYIKKKSNVIYLKYKNNNLNFISINNVYIFQKSLSKFYLYDFYINERYTLNYIKVNNISNNSLCRLYGIIIGNKNQIIENYIKIKNNYNFCNNKQYYIGIYDDKSIGIFNSIINIKKKTKYNISYQKYKNFILSDKVFLFLKPQLNILSNNIKCSHGVNIGKIDKNIIFYLQSRGIPLYKTKIIFFLSIFYKIFNNKELKYFKDFIKKIKYNLKLKLKLICK
ncbi:MAG: SufD family Fe-S cluster assembly protein [Candidatus Shikimatogenerans bostrichidophilus]|nr:MAG: SufD family Fe-S cluster assembly protein [Candidatus Shikimatogenerans bostrichidophilus]